MRSRFPLTVAAVALFATALPAPQPAPATLTVISPTLRAGQPIPTEHTMPTEITGAVQGPLGFRRPIHRGPAPPPKVHSYHFTVYALDVADLPAGLNKAQLVEAMAGHVVGQGDLVATYERKPPAPGR